MIILSSYACGPGSSEVTIPATDAEALANARRPAPPTAGDEPVEGGTRDSTRPQLKKTVQSKRILKSQPTLHYSADEGETKDMDANDRKKRSTEKPTAAKAAPKKPKTPAGDMEVEKKSKNKDKEKKEAEPPQPVQPVPKAKASPQAKLEAVTPDPATAEAVRASLNRGSTFTAAQKAAEAESPDGSDPSGDEDPPDGGLSARQIEAKKRAHARYMRFFRSVRSIMAEALWSQELLVHILSRRKKQTFSQACAHVSKCHTTWGFMDNVVISRLQDGFDQLQISFQNDTMFLGHDIVIHCVYL